MKLRNTLVSGIEEQYIIFELSGGLNSTAFNSITQQTDKFRSFSRALKFGLRVSSCYHNKNKIFAYKKSNFVNNSG
jgi:hypothetical protein